MTDQWTPVEEAPAKPIAAQAPAGWTPVDEPKGMAERFYEKSPLKPMVDELASRDLLSDPLGFKNQLLTMGKATWDPIAKHLGDALTAHQAGNHLETATNLAKAIARVANPTAPISDAVDSMIGDVKKGNFMGAAGTGSGLAMLGLVPEARAAVAETGPVIAGAARGGVRGGLEPVPSHLGFDVPASLKGAFGGGLGAEALQMGLPHWFGPVVGAAAPVVKGAFKGAGEAVEARTAARAAQAAADAKAAGPQPLVTPVTNTLADLANLNPEELKAALSSFMRDTNGSLRLPGSGRAPVPGANSLTDLAGAAKSLAERRAGTPATTVPAQPEAAAPQPTGSLGDLAKPQTLVERGLEAKRNALREQKFTTVSNHFDKYGFTPDLVDSISPTQWKAVAQSAGVADFTPDQISAFKAKFKEAHTPNVDPDMLPPGDYWHGTTAPEFSKFQDGVTYFTPRADFAAEYASNPFTKAGPEPRVLKLAPKAGRVKDVNKLMEADTEANGGVFDGDDVILDQAEKARAEGYRYLKFNHPAPGGGGHVPAYVSIFPGLDLAIKKAFK